MAPPTPRFINRTVRPKAGPGCTGGPWAPTDTTESGTSLCRGAGCVTLGESSPQPRTSVSLSVPRKRSERLFVWMMKFTEDKA